jgi:hypothetical protein
MVPFEAVGTTGWMGRKGKTSPCRDCAAPMAAPERIGLTGAS